MRNSSALGRRTAHWLLESEPSSQPAHVHAGPHGLPEDADKRRPWWQVMCLTGVDYFSSLGYQPGIAIAAAGVIAPIATVVLVALTLVGALPVYRRVAAASPHGEGSIRMLEKLLPKWAGKLFVLVLLGFAATDFMITITLSSADAAAHAVGNPLVPEALRGQAPLLTVVMILLLGAVFLKGFKEAITVAVVLVSVYLTLNAVVLGDALFLLAQQPHLLVDWTRLVQDSHHENWFVVLGIALIVFPKLALGMSGFETGVAVMPQIRSQGLEGRIAGARRLLTTSAIIMSLALLSSSIACTVLIPQEAFAEGGEANGRALAYLAHANLGNGFGTVYDISTILILWFAGASAMAGLLNLVPRYLPRYGMAPEWARLNRPLTLVFVAVALVVTWIFGASVGAQGSAYATGVLVLMTSGAVAVTLHQRRHGGRASVWFFSAISAVFVYTTIANVFERPDGVKVAAAFIVAIIAVSFISRMARAFELRATDITLDAEARRFVEEATQPRPDQLGGGECRQLFVIAHDPEKHSFADYLEKQSTQRRLNRLPEWVVPLFVEITVRDSSDFDADLKVRGVMRQGFRVLAVEAPSVGNSMAAILLYLRDVTDVVPDAYFEWFIGDPFVNYFRFLFLGIGENATVAQQVLSRAEPDASRRPRVHVS